MSILNGSRIQLDPLASVYRRKAPIYAMMSSLSPSQSCIIDPPSAFVFVIDIQRYLLFQAGSEGASISFAGFSRR
jgi:hypothetical protein